MGTRRRGIASRKVEPSQAERERLVGINYRKVQPSKIQLFPRVCALAFEIASLKYENYCPWLRSVSLASCVSYFSSIFSFYGGVHTQPSASLSRERERKSLAFCCYTISVTNARIASALCFDLFFQRRKYFFARPIRKSKSAGKKRAFQYLPFFLLELSAQCVRACMHACMRARVHACVRSFRVASRGSLTFELSNRLEATTVSEYRPVIPGYGSCRLTRRVLGVELI